MRELRDELANIIEREIDPELRVKPANGHEIAVLSAAKHGDIVTCLRGDLDSSEQNRIIGFEKWCRKITIPVTLAYMILDRCFSNVPIETCIKIDYIKNLFADTYIESHILNAIEWLVLITHHERYDLDFVIERDGDSGYKVVKNKIKNRKSRSHLKIVSNEPEGESEDGSELLAIDELDINLDSDDFKSGDFDFGPIGKNAKTPKKTSNTMDFRSTFFSRVPPTDERQMELLRAAKSKDEKVSRRALNELTKSNARLLMWWAKKLGIFMDNPLFWDVIQEGSIGIQKTAEKFEFEKGLKFSTYAGWWIRHYMQRFLAKNTFLTNVNYDDVEKLFRLKKIAREAQAQGKRMSVQDLAEATGMTVKEIRIIWGLNSVKNVYISAPTDKNGEEMSNNGELDINTAELDKNDSECERVAMSLDYKAEARIVAEMLKAVKRKMGKTIYSSSKLSKNEIIIRDIYILLRKLDLYDMPWTGATMGSISSECGVDKQRISQVLISIRPRLEREMRAVGFSEEKIEAYNTMLDYWTDVRKKTANKGESEIEAEERPGVATTAGSAA